MGGDCILVPILGLILGIFLGVQLPFVFPTALSAYVAIGILACVDSVLGAVKSEMDDKFNIFILFSGFFGNAIIAVALIYVGDRLGIQLSIAAIVVYGSRIFQNFSFIRRMAVKKKDSL